MNRERFIFILLIILVGILVLLFRPNVLGAAPEITVCRETLDEKFLSDYPGWNFNGTESIFTFSNIDWNAESPQWSGVDISANGTGVGDLTILAEEGSAIFAYWNGEEYVITTGDSNSPSCDGNQEDGTGEPDGDIDTIMIEVGAGCFSWEFQDDYGHWSVITVNGEPVYTQTQTENDVTFVRLPLGKDNDVTDPERYRLTFVGDTCND